MKKKSKAPRHRQTKASPVFIARPHELADTAKEQIAALLGYGGVDLTRESVDHQMPGHRVVRRAPGEPLILVRDPSRLNVETDFGDMLRSVEAALGVAIAGQEHLDRAPRPKDYVAAFERARRDAFRLCERLAGWSGYFDDAVTADGYHADALIEELARFVGVTTSLAKKYRAQSSQGARKEVALRAGVQILRKIFRKHYRGPVQKRALRPFAPRAEHDQRELDFVRVALLDAGVVKQSYAKTELPRLMRDPRTGPDADAPIKRLP
jgi:hypothetical protein